jgi:DNA-binding transcriptional regulator YiaG
LGHIEEFNPFSPLNFSNLRKLYRLKQKDVAYILGVSLGSVKSWETGRRNMPEKRW